MKEKGLTLDKLEGQLNWYSEAISKAVKTTALGIIAAIWAIFTADKLSINSTGLCGMPTDIAVQLAFVSAGGALLVNIIKDAANFWMTSIGYVRYEAQGKPRDEASFYYDEKNLGKFGQFLYRMDLWLFGFQLALAVLGACAFFTLVFAISVSTATPTSGAG